MGCMYNLFLKIEMVKKSANRGREYLPEFRSGAYAILVSLFNNEMEEVLKINFKFYKKKMFFPSF